MLLCFNLTDLAACGPDEYYPYGYKMFRVYDAKADQQPDQIMENCLQWQKLTSSKIPLSRRQQRTRRERTERQIHPQGPLRSRRRNHGDNDPDP